MKIKKYIKILHIFMFLGIAVFLIKPHSVSRVVDMAKTSVVEYFEEKMRTKQEYDLSTYKKFEEKEGFWKNDVIAHGCGGIDGKIYSNSEEALLLAYKNGTRMFDIDLRFTADNVLVLRHSWSDELEESNLGKIKIIGKDKYQQDIVEAESIPAYAEFRKQKIYHKYTPLSFDDILEFLQEHPDAYVICDTKEDISKTYEYICKRIKETDEKLFNQIIASGYLISDLQEIKGIYPFENLMLRQHEVYPVNYSELIKNCMENNIRAVNINEMYFKKDDMKMFEKYNIKLYIAVVDSLETYQKCNEKYENIGIVSNFLYEDDTKYIIRGNG